MRKVAFVFFFLAIFQLGFSKITIASPHAVVMNAKSQKILFQKNADKIIYPASITKVATSLFVLEKLKESQWEDLFEAKGQCMSYITSQKKIESNFSFPPYLLETDGSLYRFRVGEKLRPLDLLHAMLIRSSNEAPNILAQSVSGDIDLFVQEMNEYIRSLGCKNTHFMNPHGLHHPKHYSTTKDLAILACQLLKKPLLAQIVSLPFYEMPATNKSKEKQIKNTNQLIQPESQFFSPFALGIKTGYHKEAGYNLMAAQKQKDRTLIVVVNKAQTSKQLYRDVVKLFEHFFAEVPVERILFKQEETQFRTEHLHATKPIFGTIASDIYAVYYPSETPKVQVSLEFDAFKLPLNKGDKIGKLHIFYDEQLHESIPVFAKDAVSIKWVYSIWFKVLMWGIVLSVLGGGGAFLIYKKTRKSTALS